MFILILPIINAVMQLHGDKENTTITSQSNVTLKDYQLSFLRKNICADYNRGRCYLKRLTHLKSRLQAQEYTYGLSAAIITYFFYFISRFYYNLALGMLSTWWVDRSCRCHRMWDECTVQYETEKRQYSRGILIF